MKNSRCRSASTSSRTLTVRSARATTMATSSPPPSSS
jgi:hypothetical protein